MREKSEIDFKLIPVYGRSLFSQKLVKVSIDHLKKFPLLILYDDKGNEIPKEEKEKEFNDILLDKALRLYRLSHGG